MTWRVLAVACGGPVPTALADPARPLLLLFPADALGEALAGAFAAQNDAAILGRITALRREGDALIVNRSVFGGRLTAEVRVAPCLAVATANDIDDTDGTVSLGMPADMPIDRLPLADPSMSLEGASVVIGGGRGLDTAVFVQLDRVAKALGGAVSASLPAVDLGLAPVSQQVGQSGKFVNPGLYLAVGMSGTPQHFAGVGARARILAINTDRDAPVFGFAEAGAVSDARELMPLIADALEAMSATTTESAQC